MNNSILEPTSIDLSQEFVSEVIKGLPSDYLKLYIIALVMDKNDKAYISEVAKTANMDIMIVVSAFEYLQSKGLCTINNHSQVWIEFKANDSFVVSSVLYKDSEYNQKLQEIFGDKLITTTQFKMIYDWTDVFKLPKDVVLYLIQYCHKRKGQDVNIQYMNAVAKTWSQNEIYSVERAMVEIEKHERLSSGANKVLSYIGGFGRMPSKPEMELYSKWTLEWGFTQDAILMAIKDISTTANPSFKYIDKVLENLYSAGNTTSRQIFEHMSSNNSFRDKCAGWLAQIGDKLNEAKISKIQTFVDAGFSDNIITFAFSQAGQREKTSLNYVETILYNWKMKGLESESQIIEEIQSRQSQRDNAYKFYKIAGFDNMITGYQIENFEKWEKEFPYDLMLEVANYSKSAKNQNQYMTKVFDSLKQKGINSKQAFLDDVKSYNNVITNGNNGYIRSNYNEQDFMDVLSDIDK